mgnify:FL=1
MSRISQLSPRAARIAAVTGAITIGALWGAGPASAHVHVDSDDAVRGEYAVLTFRVPNESESGSPTTGLTVSIPNLTSVSTAVMPGWKATLDRDVAAGTVRSVSWKADPGDGIGADQFGLFLLQVKLPDSDTVSFPATQTYADGTVVHWDQPEAPGGAEPEHPVPELELSATGGHDAAAAPAVRSHDTMARALSGGALLVAVLGVGIALLRRRS